MACYMFTAYAKIFTESVVEEEDVEDHLGECYPRIVINSPDLIQGFAHDLMDSLMEGATRHTAGFDCSNRSPSVTSAHSINSSSERQNVLESMVLSAANLWN